MAKGSTEDSETGTAIILFPFKQPYNLNYSQQPYSHYLS